LQPDKKKARNEASEKRGRKAKGSIKVQSIYSGYKIGTFGK
jgi:hypothetical protein